MQTPKYYFTDSEQMAKAVEILAPLYYDFCVCLRANDIDASEKASARYNYAIRGMEAMLTTDKEKAVVSVDLREAINLLVDPTIKREMCKVENGEVTREFAANSFSWAHYDYPDENQGYVEVWSQFK